MTTCDEQVAHEQALYYYIKSQFVKTRYFVDLVEETEHTVTEKIEEGKSKWGENYGAYPVSSAISFEHFATVQLLIKCGIFVDVIINNETALHICVNIKEEIWNHKRVITIIEFLLDAGADPSAQDSCGMTLLHYAVVAKNVKMSELLVERGADYYKKNKQGQTSMDLARLNGCTQWFKDLLIRARAKHLSSEQAMAAANEAANKAAEELLAEEVAEKKPNKKRLKKNKYKAKCKAKEQQEQEESEIRHAELMAIILPPEPPPEPGVEKECVICLDARSNVRFLPCRHVCACSDCVSKLGIVSCPMCREPIIFSQQY